MRYVWMSSQLTLLQGSANGYMKGCCAPQAPGRFPGVSELARIQTSPCISVHPYTHSKRGCLDRAFATAEASLCQQEGQPPSSTTHATASKAICWINLQITTWSRPQAMKTHAIQHVRLAGAGGSQAGRALPSAGGPGSTPPAAPAAAAPPPLPAPHVQPAQPPPAAARRLLRKL